MHTNHQSFIGTKQHIINSEPDVPAVHAPVPLLLGELGGIGTVRGVHGSEAVTLLATTPPMAMFWLTKFINMFRRRPGTSLLAFWTGTNADTYVGTSLLPPPI